MGSPAWGYGCYGFPGACAPHTESAPDVSRPDLRRRNSIDVGGPIAVDTVWAADTVRVHADVTVERGVTLTIAAGALVQFQGYHGLDVQGRLVAAGEPDTRILFDRLAAPPDGPATATGDSWRGIAFRFTSEDAEPSLVRYCELAHTLDADGGALTFQGYSHCRVENTILRENTADRGGAIYCSHYAAPVLVNCLLVDNHALVSGAALYCLDAYPRLINCTITGNVDENPEPIDRAAAVVAMISKPWLLNTIVWGNPSNYFLDEAVIQAKPFHVRWCDVEFGHEGEGNVAADPIFVQEGEHPYRLREGSVCIDAGAPDTTGLYLPPQDLAGCDRVEDFRVDMGCYEGGTVICAVSSGASGVSERLLAPNRPNPFNPATTIRYALPAPGRVELSVHDLAGRLVITLVSGRQPAGDHAVRWTGRDRTGRHLPSGIYLCRLATGAGVETRRMTLAR